MSRGDVAIGYPTNSGPRCGYSRQFPTSLGRSSRLDSVTKIALAIAGSEASGGAGAQTDLKTFHQLGVFGCTSLTCIVSFDPHNDWGHRFVPVDPQVIHDQIEAAVAVHGQVDAVKIGMLGTPTTIGVVAEALESYQFPKVILDPVLICKGQEPGAALDTDNALREKLLPRADVVTPNLFETQTLAGVDEITSVEALKDAAKRIGDQEFRSSSPRPAPCWTLAPLWTSTTTAMIARSLKFLPSARSASLVLDAPWLPRSPRRLPRGPAPSMLSALLSRLSFRRSKTGCTATPRSTAFTREITEPETITRFT